MIMIYYSLITFLEGAIKLLPHPAFLNLEHEKQEMIRNACLEEFIRAGYSSASTNTMCKNANISKGLLFYYFGSKKKLLFYLTNYCTKLMVERFFEGLELKKESMFERIITWTQRKWDLSEKYPLHYGFLVKQLLDCPADLELEINKLRNENKIKALERFMQNLDLSDLRPEVSKEKALETMFFVIEGIRARNIARYRQSPRPLSELHAEIMLELEEYLDICRHGICR